MRTLDLDLRIEELARQYAAAKKQIETHPLYLRHLAGETIVDVEGYSNFETLVCSSEEGVVASLKAYDIPVQLPISKGGLRMMASTAASIRARASSTVLENITGNLKDAYKLSIAGTLLHVDEVMTERRNNEELRVLGFYTADGILYFIKDGKVKLAITREPDNLVLRHIDDAFAQLTAGGNYQADQAEAERAIKASATEIFDLNERELKRYNDEFSYLEILTTRYDKLSHEMRRLAERVYGKGNDFILNMVMLKEAGIDSTKLYVLNPEYVQKHAKDSPIGRASWLYDFFNSSYFYANDRNIDGSGRVRGVRKKTDNDQFSAQKSDSSSDFLRREVAEALPQQSHERSDLSDAFKNEVPCTPSEIIG